MINIKQVSIVLIVITISLSEIMAQDAILTSGGTAIGNNGSQTYAIGQMVYTTNTGVNGSLAQGVQQPFEILLTDIEDKEMDSFNFSIYPNPISEILNLKVENYNNEVIYLRLYNLLGMLIEEVRLTTNVYSFKTCDLPSSTYLLRVMHEQKEIKRIKIIKN